MDFIYKCHILQTRRYLIGVVMYQGFSVTRHDSLKTLIIDIPRQLINSDCHLQSEFLVHSQVFRLDAEKSKQRIFFFFTAVQDLCNISD